MYATQHAAKRRGIDMRYVMIAFVFMGWSFYELSGGDEFDAEATRLSRIELPQEPQTTTPSVRVAETPSTPNVVLAKADIPTLNLRPNPASSDAEPTRTAEQVASASAPEPVDASVSSETQSIILPSLVQSGAVVSQVSFAEDGQAASDLDRVASDAPLETRFVTGNRVNVRGGPGTSFSVVNKLVKGDEVEILQNPGEGWVQLRPLNGGPVGWMADFLLSDS